MKNIILLFASLLLLSGCQQSHLEIFPDLSHDELIEKKLSVEQMHNDIDAFLDGALMRHPDIEEYADLKQLTEQANQLKASISEPLNRVEFYRVVGKLSPYFQDGHSFLIWPYQELNKARDAGHSLFPFAVSMANNGRLQLKHAYRLGEQKLAIFSEIISINGIASDDIIRYLMQYTGGETELLRKHQVAMRFGTSLWAGYGWLDKFELELLTSNGPKIFVVSNDGDWPEIDEAAQGFVASASTSAHYYKQLSEDVGFIYLAHFDIDPDEFEDFIDKTFATMREQQIKKLIIDIRDNPGGNTDTITYLARHLAKNPFRLISKLKEKLNSENRGWFNYKGEVGDILISAWDDWESPADEDKRFSGETFLLIGPVSYSSSIVLATTLKDNEMATLVGQITGGFANQSAQGNLFNLPHSELRAYITTRMLVRPNGNLARQGVIPHYNVNEYDLTRCSDLKPNSRYKFANSEQNDQSLKLIALLLNGELAQCERIEG